MRPSISVIVCTFNRCDSLRDTLNSLTAMDVPSTIDWDIVVVDNNSKDNTRDCVTQMAQGNSRIQYLFERRPGKSYALNLGIKHSDKTYIAFTDDDVLVPRDWLTTIVGTFEANDVDCVGGKVRPLWLAPRPAWLGDELLNVLAMLDFGDELFEFNLTDRRFPYGANVALRRESLERIGLYDPALGRTGEVGGAEDKELFERLLSRGGRAIYCPASIVLHKVLPGRLEKAYFRRWHFAAGVARAKIVRSGRRLFGIELSLVKEFGKSVVSLIGAALRFCPSKVFLNETRCILYFAVLWHKLFYQRGTTQ
jgi:glycosyltransferase involved in cell wall biosynthesis